MLVNDHIRINQAVISDGYPGFLGLLGDRHGAGDTGQQSAGYTLGAYIIQRTESIIRRLFSAHQHRALFKRATQIHIGARANAAVGFRRCRQARLGAANSSACGDTVSKRVYVIALGTDRFNHQIRAVAFVTGELRVAPGQVQCGVVGHQRLAVH